MDMSLFYEGIKIGLIVALPVGPITLICVRQSLNGNFIASMAVAIATGTANLIYTLLGALSLSTITHFLDLFEKPVEFFGSLMIFAIGAHTLLRKEPTKSPRKKTNNSIAKIYFSILLLSLASPMTITLFATGFSGLEIEQTSGGYGYIGWLTSGVLIASIGWLILLSSTILFCRKWLSLQSIIWINSIAGILIILYALQRLYAVFF